MVDEMHGVFGCCTESSERDMHIIEQSDLKVKTSDCYTGMKNWSLTMV